MAVKLVSALSSEACSRTPKVTSELIRSGCPGRASAALISARCSEELSLASENCCRARVTLTSSVLLDAIAMSWLMLSRSLMITS